MICKAPQRCTFQTQKDQYIGRRVLTSICKANIGNILLNLDAVAIPKCSGQWLAEILHLPVDMEIII